MTQLVEKDATPTRPSDAQGALRRVARRARKRVRGGKAILEARRLGRRERRNRDSVLGTEPVVVSLTSYGSRIDTVHLAIESIARGTVRPARMILWIDSVDDLKALPPALERQRTRGLEVLLSDNFGPHTKYYPYVESQAEFTDPVVTADDDILYPVDWLSGLMKAHRSHPDSIVGYWIRRMSLGADGRPTNYTSWPYASDTRSHASNVPLGVSGVLYPPVMLARLREEGKAFLSVAPYTDDLWLHAIALRSGVPVRQISETPVHFLTLPGTQEETLASQNLAGSGNDRVVAGLYSPADLEKIRGVRA
jgi:hypothetical protein